MTTEYLQRIAVGYEFPVSFTRRVFSADNATLAAAIARAEPARRHRVLAVVDRGVARAWPDLGRDIGAYAEHHRGQLALVADPVVIAGGERAKNDRALPARLARLFEAARLDRQSVVLAVGGGAVLDVVGYVAAIVHRGLRIVRLPTTVLAQNDAGIGVKNGVNAFGKKNFLGTFAPPFAVVNDEAFLSTLAPRDVIAGMAEAVKVACIRDAAFFDWLEANVERLVTRELDAVVTLVRRCAELHLRHIATSGDPFELGSARPLDFGHWAAHKLESLTAHALRHGEAVAIGMALDSIYSAACGRLAADALGRILGLLDALGLPLWHPALARAGGNGRPAVLDGLDDFREHLGGELTITLLQEIGRGVEVHAMDPALVVEAIARLRSRQHASAERSTVARTPRARHAGS